MSAPANVDASGSTGLFETWHYRYVGVAAATEIYQKSLCLEEYLQEG